MQRKGPFSSCFNKFFLSLSPCWALENHPSHLGPALVAGGDRGLLRGRLLGGGHSEERHRTARSARGAAGGPQRGVWREVQLEEGLESLDLDLWDQGKVSEQE